MPNPSTQKCLTHSITSTAGLANQKKGVTLNTLYQSARKKLTALACADKMGREMRLILLL